MAVPDTPVAANVSWYRGITRYQWWILVAAFMG